MPFELKATINLPKTAFPMKANLPPGGLIETSSGLARRILHIVRSTRAE